MPPLQGGWGVIKQLPFKICRQIGKIYVETEIESFFNLLVFTQEFKKMTVGLLWPSSLKLKVTLSGGGWVMPPLRGWG